MISQTIYSALIIYDMYQIIVKLGRVPNYHLRFGRLQNQENNFSILHPYAIHQVQKYKNRSRKLRSSMQGAVAIAAIVQPFSIAAATLIKTIIKT